MNKKPILWLGAGIIAILILAGILFMVPKQQQSANGTENGQATTTDTTGAPAMLAVVSPNGGEVLASGQKYTITWNETGLDKVYISLVNGGKEFGTMGPFTASDKKYEWAVPDMGGWVSSGLDPKNFKIFISSNSTPESRDESDATFTITSASSTAGTNASGSSAIRADL